VGLAIYTTLDERGSGVALQAKDRLRRHTFNNGCRRFDGVDQSGRLAEPDASIVRIAVRECLSMAWPLYGDICFELFFSAMPAVSERIIRKKLRRSELLEFFKELPPCLVGMEACGTAHHWGRELTALGHDARLASRLCQAVRQARQERRGRCGSDL
jgi:hypothetical protein